jgi:hypothetical protein
MKARLILLVALMLGACDEKKEEPAPVQNCVEVTVIHSTQDTNPHTLMEYTMNGKPYRMSRSGYFGAPGDRFTFCQTSHG